MIKEQYALVSPDKEVIEIRNYAPNVDQKLLSPNKPKMLIVEDIVPEYDKNIQDITKEYEVLEDKVIVKYNITEKTKKDVDLLVSKKIQQIKDEARRRIYEILLDHQQINAMAKGLEMLLLYGFPQDGKWPDDQKKRIAGLIAKWNTIEAIRHKSDELEANLYALTDPKEISAFDPLTGWD